MTTQPRAKTFKTGHRASFNVLDPFGHMSAHHYLGYFTGHRWTGMREVLGLDLRALLGLPFFMVTRSAAIDFIVPIAGDEAFEITSSIERIEGANVHIPCTMSKLDGTVAARCQLVLTCVSRETKRPVEVDRSFIDKFFEQATE